MRTPSTLQSCRSWQYPFERAWNPSCTYVTCSNARSIKLSCTLVAGGSVANRQSMEWAKQAKAKQPANLDS